MSTLMLSWAPRNLLPLGSGRNFQKDYLLSRKRKYLRSTIFPFLTFSWAIVLVNSTSVNNLTSHNSLARNTAEIGKFISLEKCGNHVLSFEGIVECLNLRIYKIIAKLATLIITMYLSTTTHFHFVSIKVVTEWLLSISPLDCTEYRTLLHFLRLSDSILPKLGHFLSAIFWLDKRCPS